MRFETHLPNQMPHLTDDQLIEAYLLAGDNPHLADCGQCRARYDDLAHPLEMMRGEAVLEADAIFTSERLHDQRDRILRRLERQGHPAEVLLFPSRPSGHPVVRRVLGPARRWVAGAAAAGLAAGVFLGFAMDRRSHVADRGLSPAAVTEAMAWTRHAADSRDEQILSEIEDALVGPRRVLELRALDVMTTPPELQEASFEPQ